MIDLLPEDKTPMWYKVVLAPITPDEDCENPYKEFVYFNGADWDKEYIEDMQVVKVISKA